MRKLAIFSLTLMLVLGLSLGNARADDDSGGFGEWVTCGYPMDSGPCTWEGYDYDLVGHYSDAHGSEEPSDSEDSYSDGYCTYCGTPIADSSGCPNGCYWCTVCGLVDDSNPCTCSEESSDPEYSCSMCGTINGCVCVYCGPCGFHHAPPACEEESSEPEAEYPCYYCGVMIPESETTMVPDPSDPSTMIIVCGSCEPDPGDSSEELP